ncbi:MAG: zinc-dependent metalloprotease [Pseudobdellovibrionaceae bacterium]
MKSFSLMGLVSLVVLTASCTKTREAQLPEDIKENVFAISEFGQIQDSSFHLSTSESNNDMSVAEQSKAINEKKPVAVVEAEVPERFKAFFKNLQISAKADATYTVGFFLDPLNITVFKKVPATESLSSLELGVAKSLEELQSLKQLQATSDPKINKQLKLTLQKQQLARQKLATAKSSMDLYVPLFQVAIKSYGTLEKIKNDVGDSTSKLQLKPSNWTEATHIQLSMQLTERKLFISESDDKLPLDQTFLADSIDHKVMTSESLAQDFGVNTNIASDAKVLTVLEPDSLNIYEITNLAKADLPKAQIQQLKEGLEINNISRCSDQVKKHLTEEEQKDCVQILRISYPIKYVQSQLNTNEGDGILTNNLKLSDTTAQGSNNLVLVPKNALGKQIINNNILDPRTTLRVADIKDKEFFYRRTLEDAPVTTTFAPGIASDLKIIKFILEEKRLVIRQADSVVNFKNGNDRPELMSIPVRYLKRELTDASGSKYANPQIVETVLNQAEYIQLDWTQNKTAELDSPLSVYGMGQCFKDINDTQVQDVKMKLQEGILNFSLQYSVNLEPLAECMGFYSTSDIYGGNSLNNATTNAVLKERISFKWNDGKSDSSFAPEVPFSVQNQLGYGVFTLGQIKPSENGVYGREGSQSHKSILHDFRNGKILTYTLANLPTDDSERRGLYIEAVKSVVQSWNQAYQIAFRGSSLARTSDYVQLIIDENNETHLGDIDKNIIWIDNKNNDNHGILGISQVGPNPRSGIIVADSLIVYAANVAKAVEVNQRDTKNVLSWKKQISDLKDKYQKEISPDSTSAPAANSSSLSESELDQLLGQKQRQRQGLGNSTSIQRPASLPNFQATSLLKSRNILKSINQDRISIDPESSAQKYSLISSTLSQYYMNKLKNKPNMSIYELENVVAEGMLKQYKAQISETEKLKIQRRISLNQIKERISQLSKNGSCFMTSSEALAVNFSKLTFNEALKKEFIYTLSHEMGHSQGLTHNFMGSFDKDNFTNLAKPEKENNYSSVMDYINYGFIDVQSLGAYDIHAMQAAHTGNIEKADGKGFINIQEIKKLSAPGGWTTFNQEKIKDLIKPYKFCTDIDVGNNPTCQRFDFGTSAEEIVRNSILDHNNFYIHAYHGWDRLEFNFSNAVAAITRSFSQLINMRQFLDETFYLLIEKGSTDENQLQDYFKASIQSYKYYLQMLRTPDAGKKDFISLERFTPVKYEYKDESGEDQVGFDLLEAKSLSNIAITDYRLDTIGYENDKAMAINLLTLRGLPKQRYASNLIEFSFVDMEKYLLQLNIEKDSLVMNTLLQIFSDDMTATITNDQVLLQAIDGNKVTQSGTVRLQAAIGAILSLEASVIQDKDNNANLFKIGSSVGEGPQDRLRLSNLGVSENSKARLSFWAIDNATYSQQIVNKASALDFFIKSKEQLIPPMKKLFLAQLADHFETNKDSVAAIEIAKSQLLDSLKKINDKGQIVSEKDLQLNPNLALDKQVDILVTLNAEIFVLTDKILKKDPEAGTSASNLITNISNVKEFMPLLAIEESAIFSAITDLNAVEKPSETAGALSLLKNQVVSENSLEIKYALLIKNIELLNKLTLMTNPELSHY